MTLAVQGIDRDVLHRAIGNVWKVQESARLVQPAPERNS
jgi:hypothetical protein